MQRPLVALPSQVRWAANGDCLKLARSSRVLNNCHSSPATHQRREGGFSHFLARPPPTINDLRRRRDSKGRVPTTLETRRNRDVVEGLSRGLGARQPPIAKRRYQVRDSVNNGGSNMSNVYPLKVEVMSDPIRFNKDAFDTCVRAFSDCWNDSKDTADPYVFLAGLLSLVYSKFFQKDSYSVAVMTDREREDSDYYSEAMFYSAIDALAYARCLSIFYGEGVTVEVGFKAEGAYAFFDVTSLCHELHS